MAHVVGDIEIKVEVDISPGDSSDVHLCTACLCATRTTRTLDDDTLKQYYMDILTEAQYPCMVSPDLCWECASLLQRTTQFREQVKRSHYILHSVLQTCDLQVLDQELVGRVEQPARLQTSVRDSVDIWPGLRNDDAPASDDEGDDDDDDDDDDADGDAEMLEPEVQIKEEDVSDDEQYVMDPADALECELRELDSADSVKPEKEGTSTTQKIKHFDEKTIMKLTLLRCPRCIYTTISPQALERHSRLHDTSRPYQCEICHRGFNRTDGLKRHMTIHTRVKEPSEENRIYECTICQKKLTRSTHLKDHMRTHSGEKPYNCSVCKRAFSSTCDLTRHWRTHTKEKPYVCPVCQKAFTSSSDWKKHLRIHTGEKPYQCEVCHKACTNRNGLKLHMRTHTGEKPYPCELCEKRFASTSDLARHTKTHTKEKPYSCKICQKLFSRSNGLRLHLQKNHVPSTATPCA